MNGALTLLTAGRRRRTSRWRAVALTLLALVLAGFALTLMSGQSLTPPGQVLRILARRGRAGLTPLRWGICACHAR